MGGLGPSEEVAPEEEAGIMLLGLSADLSGEPCSTARDLNFGGCILCSGDSPFLVLGCVLGCGETTGFLTRSGIC